MAGCTAPAAEPVSPIARRLAGCYELLFGPWLTPKGTVLDSARWNAPSFLPPRIVQLDTVESEVPIRGHWRLLPQPPAGSLFRSATWRATADSLILEWSTDDRLGSAAMFAALVREPRQYAGRTYTETDFRMPRPYRHTLARRTSCEGLAQPESA